MRLLIFGIWLWQTLFMGSLANDTAVADEEPWTKIVQNTYLVQLQEWQDVDYSANVVAAHHGTVLFRYYIPFRGLSIRFGREWREREVRALVPGAKAVWPVKTHKTPVARHEDERELKTRMLGEEEETGYAPLVMTQVDKFRRQGLTGRGIKVAIVDSGIDYSNEALGGCFGADCMVSFGYNFADSNDDVKDCLGHGTQVAGIIAAQPNHFPRFSGVAPGVKLGAYRIAGCDGTQREDYLIAAFNQAYKDRVDVVNFSAGFSQGWSQGPIAEAASALAHKGVIVVIAAANNGNTGIFYASSPGGADGVLTVSSVLNGGVHQLRYAQGRPGVDMIAMRHNGGSVDATSSWGPNWDMGHSVDVAGVGGKVVTTGLGNGIINLVSGTSFAAPLVAGIVALMLEARPGLTGDMIRRRMIATAQPTDYYTGTEFLDRAAPPAQQGAGIVQGWDAFEATTLLEPARLSFNDSEHMPVSLTLTLTNLGDDEVEYSFSNKAAVTVYAMEPRTGRFSNQHPTFSYTSPSTATLGFSSSEVVVMPGQSMSINISATPPPNADVTRLPLWSGYVRVRGSDGSSFVVPYQGLTGSLRQQPVFGPQGMRIGKVVKDEATLPAQGLDFTYSVDDNNELRLKVPMTLVTRVGSPLMRASIVPLGAANWLARRLVEKNIQMMPARLSPLQWVPRGRVYLDYWDGLLESGDFLPRGEYKVIMHALRIFGNEAEARDWDVAESKAFRVFGVGGAQACRVYSEAGPAHADALFKHLDECLEKHGRDMSGKWVMGGQDDTRCDVERPTEHECGTYRFCKAHDDQRIVTRLETRYTSSYECVMGHELLPNLVSSLSNAECEEKRDEEACGSYRWCILLFRGGVVAGKGAGQFGNMEECEWAHGIFETITG
ncbi:hypothetical protein CDD82_5992 [Ophiocordyceps australis]|uniref:Peptidase S8/S53 domain-containing protein n=1 Tax=Ophiocordyceps australis TaxID=1399860 RepID=A0A2C5YZR5_9HYPO|nr:hypothetical protein CDD82_5992 [Ophiocordyceps australis]